MIKKIVEKLKYKKERADFARIYKRLASHTMIPQDIYVDNLQLANHVKDIPGAIVECGTWKGGMIAGFASVLGSDRDYHLFDSFEGLPPAQDIDGPAALAWQSNTSSSNYHNNCTAPAEDAVNAMRIAGVENPKIYPGWFNETLPLAEFSEGIAILRLDSDWYESELTVYNHLFDLVNENGLVILDDYYVYDGCARALHDFLSQNSRTERILQRRHTCYLIKR